MLPSLAQAGNRLAQAIARLRDRKAHRHTPPTASLPPRPSLSRLAQPDAALPRFVAEDAVARKYLDLLGPLDWDHFPERPCNRPWPGPEPTPRAPYVAAELVKLNEGLRSMGHLRRYLVEHPALVWLLGFPLGARSDLATRLRRRALPAVPPPTRPCTARTRPRRRPVPADRHRPAALAMSCRPTSTSAISSPAIPSTSSPGSKRITPNSTSKIATTRPNSPKATRTASSAARNAATRATPTVIR